MRDNYRIACATISKRSGKTMAVCIRACMDAINKGKIKMEYIITNSEQDKEIADLKAELAEIKERGKSLVEGCWNCEYLDASSPCDKCQGFSEWEVKTAEVKEGR